MRPVLLISNPVCFAYRKYAAKSIKSNHFIWSLVQVFNSQFCIKKNKYN